ncbi:hypothetical protein KEM52_000043 [Ascosphaera acerosa]|nr:hypothetical protein KEM52_000043 [Ascosphaera acerosa]
MALLEAGLQKGASASGGDLAIMLVRDVYVKAEWDCDHEGVEQEGRMKRLIDLLWAFPYEEPTRKRFLSEMITWSADFGDYETGHPTLHWHIGKLAAEDQEPYEAESHLALANERAPELLADLEHEWYTHNEPHTAGVFACRAVVPFLLAGTLQHANRAFDAFVRALTRSGKSVPVQQVSGQSVDVQFFPTLPLLNFLRLLLATIQRGAQSQDLFRQLAKQYAAAIEEVDGLEPAVARIGEVYFGLAIPRQSNMLMDMMGAMFGGGPGASGGQAPQKRERRRRRNRSSLPSSMEVD